MDRMTGNFLHLDPVCEHCKQWCSEVLHVHGKNGNSMICDLCRRAKTGGTALRSAIQDALGKGDRARADLYTRMLMDQIRKKPEP
jgi:hypothetical protein